MTIPEETGKVATSAIEALKVQPALLVLVLLQFATLGSVYFAQQANQDRTTQRELAILNRCFPPSHHKE